jgi:hypothetical protein
MNSNLVVRVEDKSLVELVKLNAKLDSADYIIDNMPDAVLFEDHQNSGRTLYLILLYSGLLQSLVFGLVAVLTLLQINYLLPLSTVLIVLKVSKKTGAVI